MSGFPVASQFDRPSMGECRDTHCWCISDSLTHLQGANGSLRRSRQSRGSRAFHTCRPKLRSAMPGYGLSKRSPCASAVRGWSFAGIMRSHPGMAIPDSRLVVKFVLPDRALRPARAF